jgi:hypothetical protein
MHKTAQHRRTLTHTSISCMKFEPTITVFEWWKPTRYTTSSSFFCWRYSPQWTLASSRTALHWFRFCVFRLQFLMAIIFRRSSIESSHLIAGLPTRPLPPGLRRVNFLQGFCSCILKLCPSHLNLPDLITFIFSTSGSLILLNRWNYSSVSGTSLKWDWTRPVLPIKHYRHCA